TSFSNGFKYSKNNYYSAGHAQHSLPEVRENEQPKKARFGSGKLGCLFAQTRKRKNEQTTDLSSRGVAS
ncbi:MAG: hypothetical protein AB1485_06610, partial [Candidatus Thermoplasmatota archaeon]